MSVVLRKPSVDDASQILEWENDPDNWEVSLNEGEYSLEDIEALIQSLDSDVSQARYMIDIQGNSVGAIDFYEIQDGSSGVGILVDKSFRRKGIARKALKALDTIASHDYQLNRLFARIDPTNEASIKLFISAGYFKKDVKEEVKLPNGDYIQVLIFEKWLKS